MKQVFNPYLPAGEYIPDGEPHVFGNRVYVYGSHDRFNAAIFCVNDYVCYSAPVDDLSAWRYEGVIYKKKQDPLNKLGIRLLFAPDVVQGVDGRYYLYYAYDFLGRMGVAVSDKPQARMNTTAMSVMLTGASGAAAPGMSSRSTPVRWWMTTGASTSTPASRRKCRSS